MTSLKQLQQEMEKEFDKEFMCKGYIGVANKNDENYKKFTLKYMQKVADMYEKELERLKDSQEGLYDQQGD